MSKKTNKTVTVTVPAEKLSLLNAAATILEKSEAALNCKQMISMAKAAGLWEPGAGKTPELTLYSAIKREMKTKGDKCRFAVSGVRGHFTFRSSAN